MLASLQLVIIMRHNLLNWKILKNKSNKNNLFNLNNKVYYKITIIQKFQTNLIFKRSCLYFLKIYKKFSII